METARKILGVIGGLGPIATAHFMELVINMTDVAVDQQHVPMIVYNMPYIPVVLGSVLVVSFFVCVINLLVDLLYGFLDPRIKAQYTGGKKKSSRKAAEREAA